MIPYLVCFALSLTVILFIQNWRHNTVGFIFWSFIALLIPCILAGWRGYAVGTDIGNYAKPLFDLADNALNCKDFMGSSWYRVYWISSPQEFEIGYVLLVWISARFFGSFQALLFFTQLLTIVPIYIAATSQSQRCPLALSMGMYYFLYYNSTLNMMRQWIAMAFVMLALIHLYKTEVGILRQQSCFAAILFGCLFHVTALIALPMVLLRSYLDSTGTHDSKKIIVTCLIGLVLLFGIRAISYVLTILGLGYYVGYLGDLNLHIMPDQIILRLPLLCLAWYAYIRTLRSGKKCGLAAFILCMVFYGTLCSQLLSLNSQSGRIATYFDMFSMAVPSLLLSTFRRSDLYRSVISVFISLYFVGYWAYYYLSLNVGETIPYIWI